MGSGQVRQGILTNGFAKAPNPNARLLSLPGRFDLFRCRLNVVVFLLHLFVAQAARKAAQRDTQ